MKRFHQVWFPAAVFLILLCGTGCDDSSKTSSIPKPARKTSFAPSKAPTSAEPRPSSGDSKEPSGKKQEKNKDASQTEGTAKPGAQPGAGSEKKASSSSKGNGGTPSGSGKKTVFSSDKNEAGGTRKTGSGTGNDRRPSGSGAGNYRPDGSGTGNDRPSGSGRKTVPSGWFRTDIKNHPQPARLTIWNNILSSLKNLIVARHVEFSPLGAEHTLLTDLSADQYKAAGRCIVIEKSGNQMAYEFECVAKVTPYEAAILSVKFHLRN